MSQHQPSARPTPRRAATAPTAPGSPTAPTTVPSTRAVPPPPALTSVPDYLQQRVAFPSRPAPVPPRVITEPGRTRGVGSRLQTISSPRLVVALMTLCTTVVLLFGLTVATVLVQTAGAMQRAGHNAEQLVRVQNIESQLLRADALATNAFLVAGLEDAGSRRQFDEALADASTLLVEAGRAQPADQEALQVVAAELTRYAASAAQARANNRQGYPVGASYLGQASTRLRETAVPALEAAARANTGRLVAEARSGSVLLVVVAGTSTLAVLAVAGILLARRFHRTFNLGLVAAAVLVLVATAVAAGTLAAVSSRVDDLERAELSTVRHLSAARAGALDAKALESLTLVARGSGGAFEEAWQQQADAVADALEQAGTPDLAAAWQRHVEAHAGIRTLDDAGDWAAAVQAATADGPSNRTAQEFQDRLAPVLGGDVVQVVDRLGGQTLGLVIAAGLTGLLVLGAGTAVLAGLEQRRREFL
ncbi:hypothetical protein DT076_00145 [Desertihabitans brevis]|uniref:Chemotaxis methyl-accepting receptor HlyB-like 4HB MCP domain-containing protein n=1 Tax=Desertihabitans brevis TaxID=2268447 RepID=A0A367Z149_9ACTN|nr:hypothetical protein [Desertihabitans brevis]RCK70941.1 hypothetical protein DT076_00145 [Desertihabitans brevis]